MAEIEAKGAADSVRLFAGRGRRVLGRGHRAAERGDLARAPHLIEIFRLLTWRPLERPPAEQVEMKVRDGLASVFAAVVDDAVAVL